jgi:opacity protein-like surface antigen
MKFLCILLGVTLFGASGQAFEDPQEKFDPQRFELSLESGYIFGVFNPPQTYQIVTEFVTARIRCGVFDRKDWLRGYNQFYVSAIAEPLIQGIENYYFGINFGGRYNFVQPGRRLNPYFSGGLGLGWIDSHSNVFGGQGQDFTFNILTAAGVSYQVDHNWKVDIGVLYQHFSNGGQTDPNPSVNLVGPQLGLTYSF